MGLNKNRKLINEDENWECGVSSEGPGSGCGEGEWCYGKSCGSGCLEGSYCDDAPSPESTLRGNDKPNSQISHKSAMRERCLNRVISKVINESRRGILNEAAACAAEGSGPGAEGNACGLNGDCSGSLQTAFGTPDGGGMCLCRGSGGGTIQGGHDGGCIEGRIGNKEDKDEYGGKKKKCYKTMSCAEGYEWDWDACNCLNNRHWLPRDMREARKYDHIHESQLIKENKTKCNGKYVGSNRHGSYYNDPPCTGGQECHRKYPFSNIYGCFDCVAGENCKGYDDFKTRPSDDSTYSDPEDMMVDLNESHLNRIVNRVINESQLLTEGKLCVVGDGGGECDEYPSGSCQTIYTGNPVGGCCYPGVYQGEISDHCSSYVPPTGGPSKVKDGKRSDKPTWNPTTDLPLGPGKILPVSSYK